MKKLIIKVALNFFSQTTIKSISYDLKRLRVRKKNKNLTYTHAQSNKLHLGCGKRKISGWLNVDIENSDHDVDLGNGFLPWPSESFDAIVSQHVIEHLHLSNEIVPLMREIRRVIKKDGELWISCPDIHKICESYMNYRMVDLLEDRKNRFPDYSLHEMPSSHFINELFYQGGMHKNLFDYEILNWLLHRSGFISVEKVDESKLLKRFPEFPFRNDDKQTIYMRAFAADSCFYENII